MKKVYLNELEEVGTELVNYSKNDIANKIKEFNTITENFEWQGISRDAYVKKMNDKVNKILKWNDDLYKIASFLFSATDDYGNTSEKINKLYEQLIDEIKKGM